MNENLPTMQVVAVLVVRFVRKNAVESNGHRCAKCLTHNQKAIEQQRAVAATSRSTSEIGMFQQLYAKFCTGRPGEFRGTSNANQRARGR